MAVSRRVMRPAAQYRLLDHLPLVPGPGAPGRGGAPGAVLFAASACAASLDLLAAFWREVAPGLDWRRDFLCDPAAEALYLSLENPPEEDEEAEMIYSRSQLTTLGSEVMDGP